MRITAVETVRLKRFTRFLWVRIHTDAGITGWGETYDKVGPAKTAVHEICARFLIGRDPRDIEKIWQDLFAWMHYHGYAAAEMRALSAIDTALWDLLGKHLNTPIWRLLGGKVRDRVPLYATCVERSVALRKGDFSPDKTSRTAEQMLQRGFSRIKIDPFHYFSDQTGGQRISRLDLETGLAELQGIRDAFGNKVEVAVDAHCAWNYPSAVSIAEGLEPLHPMFLEEPLISDDAVSLARLAAATRIPICESERLFTRWQFKPLIDQRALSIAMPDLAWTGGISETRKIAILCETSSIPIAPHNCGGPGTFVASLHVCASVPNLFLLESVPEFVDGFYGDLVASFPKLENGEAAPPDGPGLGVELRDEIWNASDAEREISTEPSEWGFSPIHKN
ncbi:MAG: mandelate racemase/muconate lactonizing enzyme family protein [Treponemataceae bacterium]